MRVTTQSDFALRVLVFAGLSGERPCRIREIAEAYGISQSHLTKVVWKLSEHGFLATARGRAGGLRLARAPGEIGLGDVLRRMEDTQGLVECFGPGNACVITPACAARRMFREAEEAFFATFDRYTLADLLARGDGLRRLLALAS